MAPCTVHTPNEHVNAAFLRLFPFLHLRRSRGRDGFDYALRHVATGEYRYRATGEEGLCVMSDNV